MNPARHLARALRSLARQQGMVLIVVVTLALGIGASTALFAYLAAILWPAVDGPEPESVVWVDTATSEEPFALASYPEYLELQRQRMGLRDLAGVSNFGASVSHGQESVFAWGQFVSGGYFSFFAARPTLGRLLQPADDRPDAEPVVVASYLFWRGFLGGDPGAVGRPLRLNGQIFTLIGVAPKGFQGQGRVSSLYAPLAQSDRVTWLPRLANRERRWVILLGRLAPGVTLEQGREALRSTARALDEAAPLPAGKRRYNLFRLTTYNPGPEPDPYLTGARVLMAAALLFLLLACANVANLLLARAAVRQREWGIRASLGASRRRLVAGVLAESLILCLAAGLLGLAFAVGIGRRIELYVVTSLGGLGDWSKGSDVVRLDLRVFAFALGVALLCGLLCGLVPALRVMRGDLFAAVKSDAAGATGPAGALLPRKLLVVAQVALSVVLLLGGSLLVRTLRAAERMDPGFDPRHLLLASLYVPRSIGTVEEGATATYRRVLEEAAALPGVESVTLAHAVPLAGWSHDATVERSERPGEPVDGTLNLVAPGYFATMGIPILQGRALDQRDRRHAPAAVVISRMLAEKLWGNENPLGRHITSSDPVPKPGDSGPVFEVVGVAADVRAASLVEPPAPLVYFSVEQRSHARLTLIVRTAAAANLAPGLRRALHAA